MTLTTGLIVTGVILAVFAGYAVIAPTFINFFHYAQRMRVNCPNFRTTADINLSGIGSAFASAYSMPWHKILRCSLLHRGETCDEGCLKTLRI